MTKARARRIVIAILPALVLAGGFVAYASLSSLQPARPPAQVLDRSAPWVEVAPLTRRTVSLDVVANGTVRARDSITVGPEVAGRVAFVSSSLHTGSFVAAGDVLVRLDDREPSLALRLAQAELAQVRAELARLVAAKRHMTRSVELRREGVDLANAEYERQRTLAKSGAASQGRLDQARSAWAAERSAYNAAEQALDLLPHDVARLRAGVARAEAASDRSQLNLDRLVLRAPLAGQVRLRQVEVGQVVAPGTVLARVDSHAVYEVAVQISHDDLTKLEKIPDVALPTDLHAPPGFAGSAAAEVTWLAHPEAPWPARISRIESVDTRTRTLPVVVEVERPWDRLATGATPLLPGAYCRVRLAGRKQADAWVVPERSLREGDRLFVLRDGRLAIVPVAIEHMFAGEAVVAPAITLLPGDEVILSSVTYPVEGMRLRVQQPSKP